MRPVAPGEGWNGVNCEAKVLLAPPQCLLDSCPLGKILCPAPGVCEPPAFGQIFLILTRPQFKSSLFGDIPAKYDDQITACVIFSSQSDVYDLLFTAFAPVRALDRDGISQRHRADQLKNPFPRGACGKIPWAHFELLLPFIAQQRAASRIPLDNPAVE